MRFQLLAGRHHETVGRDAAGYPKIRSYRVGDTIESPVDLCRLHNAPGSPKYLDLGHPGAPAVQRIQVVDLTKMTLEELRQYAEEENFDLGDAVTQRDVLRAVRAARASVGAS